MTHDGPQNIYKRYILTLFTWLKLKLLELQAKIFRFKFGEYLLSLALNNKFNRPKNKSCKNRVYTNKTGIKKWFSKLLEHCNNEVSILYKNRPHSFQTNVSWTEKKNSNWSSKSHKFFSSRCELIWSASGLDCSAIERR